MIRKNYNNLQRVMAMLAAFAIFAMPVAVFSQTKISYHSNKYKPTDDVKVGRQAAAEAEQQLPILNDAQTTNYVSRIGMRLVSAIPPEFQHPEFQYYFKVVNASDINAFALPGGPMYVNRGMIQAARNEGEMAGVNSAKGWFAGRHSRHWRPDHWWTGRSGSAGCGTGCRRLLPEVQPRI